MKKIVIKKIETEKLEVLQNEIIFYSEYIAKNHIKTDFLNAIICLDIANILYYLLRNKIEKHKKEHTVSFTLSQAATIMKMYNTNLFDRTPYQLITFITIQNQIDQQLKSFL